jgi:Cd2+/Zn2+-exporting ATPase
VSLLRKRLAGEEGIHELRFDIFKAKMSVDYDPALWAAPQIERAVADTGLRAEAWQEQAPRETFWHRRGRTLLVSLSGLLMLAAIIAQGVETGNLMRAFFAHDHDHGHMSGLVVALSLGAILAGSYCVLPKAWRSLLRLEPDMNLLVTISLAGAAYLGEWLEGASLSFLFALAALLESYSMARARKAVTALMKEAPGEASVVHGDHEHKMPVERVGVGSRVRVRPGERIPCDGRVIEGGSDVNQAMITGESLPVWKGAGDEVFAGTVNGDGMLEMETTQPAGETALARIARVVERAQH